MNFFIMVWFSLVVSATAVGMLSGASEADTLREMYFNLLSSWPLDMPIILLWGFLIGVAIFTWASDD